uniref:Carboxylic ester hydrolase n=1 Tax=Meteorus pulchricornis TaxID=51522 RepID=A0A9E8DEQ9_9HYME|nr:carboxylesterase 27 [Meteorus pulchricornis]
MGMNLGFAFLIVFFGICLKSYHCELTSVIQTDKGPVRGEIIKTFRNNVEFSSFRGIRYGKPPIGHSRFMPPEEAEPWSEIFNATKEATPCPQMDPVFPASYIGDEDCLNLNVYTPRKNFQNLGSNLNAVMIWLHGGRYLSGYTNITYFGPDYLIENNVVVVVTNFRLGALGHLALNLQNASGNAALKDQRLAFRWVKKNIKLFGGDPNSVTIFGESTGGSAVDLHVLSDGSRGLFHRSISMSASPLCDWATATIPEMKIQAFLLGKRLGIRTNDSQELLTALYDTPAEDIIRATSVESNLRPFKPVIEDADVAGASAFLTECSIRKYTTGDFNRLPHMTGFMASEALLYFESLPMLSIVADDVSQQSALVMADIPADILVILSNIMGGLPQTIITDRIHELMAETITNITDILYTSPIDTKQRLMQVFTPVYYYKISIAPEESYHKYRGVPMLSGAAHGDDVPYIWHTPIFPSLTDPDDSFVMTRNRLTRMWTNFAKFSDPTPLGTDDLLLNVTWPVSGPHGFHLEINHQLTVGTRPIDSITKKIQAAYSFNSERYSECT